MKSKNLFFAIALSIGLLITSCNISNGISSSDGVDFISSEHEHIFSTSWEYSSTYHWHSCLTCDERKDVSEHLYSEWIIDIQPTDTQTGSRHRTCNICGYKVSEIMPIEKHTHVWDEPTYTWNYDYSTCTARRECFVNRHHYEEEVAESTYELMVSPSASTDGIGYYIATFENSAFETQYHEIRIPKSGVAVTGVSLYPETIEMSIGDTHILMETVEPSDASNKTVSWSSSNTNVATVSNYGIVTARANGKATITVKTQDGGFTATCTIEVKEIAVTGVSLSSNTLTIEVGKTSTLYATIAPSSATNKNVTWSSNDQSVATVNQNGRVTAVKKGNTSITVKTQDGGFTATCAVEVLDKENFSYVVGETVVENYDYTSYSSVTHKIKMYTPITNNGNVAIYISSCTMDIEDSAGNLKATYSYLDVMPNIIRPGETAYVYEDRTYEGDVFTGLVGIPHLTIKNAKSANSNRYALSEIQIESDDYYSFHIIGRMTNNTSNKTSLVYVVFNIFDKNNNFYATLYDIITDDLNPGESIGFKANCIDLLYHKDFKISDIGRYEAFAYEWDIVI